MKVKDIISKTKLHTNDVILVENSNRLLYRSDMEAGQFSNPEKVLDKEVKELRIGFGSVLHIVVD